jgi:hypothetical protein
MADTTIEADKVVMRQPIVIPFADGDLTGAFGPVTGNKPPGTIRGYDPAVNLFHSIPAITHHVARKEMNAPPIKKRIVYVNGVGTPMQAHANTVKIIAVVSKAAVVGIYNASGNGKDPEWYEAPGNIINDLIQCIGDKLQISENMAATTLAFSVFESCTHGAYLNIVAHSQGAIITSYALRKAIKMLVNRYARMSSEVRPFLEAVEKRRGFWESLGRGMIKADDYDRLRLNAVLKKEILPLVEKRLQDFVSVQTFGGAGRFFPNGPKYRHVVNGWDPVPRLFGQGDLVAGPGRGGRVEILDRGHLNPARNHSMDEVYLGNGHSYVDGNGKKIDDGYVPIDLSMVRSK